MGYVSKTNSIGDAVTTLTFEHYEDFMRYEGQDHDRHHEVINRMFDAPQEQAYHYLQLTEQEYYYLSCILGHLVPAGKISKSLLSKVSSYYLGCKDFDLVKFKGNEIGGYSITLDGDEE